MNVLQPRHGEGCLGCMTEEEEQQTRLQLNTAKNPSPSDSFLIQQLLVSAKYCISHRFLSSSLAYVRAVALLVLAAFSTCPPLPPTSRAFLLIQLNRFNYLTGHKMANICWLI